jgi:hypothetical protein
MGLTNEAVEGELGYSSVRKSEDNRRGWEGHAYLDSQGGLSDASITQYCNSPTVHIWKGRRGSGGC